MNALNKNNFAKLSIISYLCLVGCSPPMEALSSPPKPNNPPPPSTQNDNSGNTSPELPSPREERATAPLFPSFGSHTNCLETDIKGANACIFRKNPVADYGSPLTRPPVLNTGPVINNINDELEGLVDMSYIQTFAVQIPGENLVNNDFIISDLNGTPLKATKNNNGNWKYPFHRDKELHLIQIHLFYWLNHLTEKVNQLTGASYTENKKIYAIPLLPFEKSDEGLVFHNNAFWTGPQQNFLVFGISIKLAQNSEGQELHAPLALDTGIVAHELGHAMLDYSVNTALRSSSTLEMWCGSARCSRFLEGSLGAIHEGVGDIVSLILFPNSPSIGELFYNKLSGLTHCNDIPRNMKEIKDQNLTAEDLFNSCSNRDKPGEIHAFGSVYSTIWYGVFQRAFERGGENERNEAYRLFFEHLKNLTQDDSFESAREIIKSLDQNLFDGKFSQDLDTEYQLLGYEI